MLFEGVLLRAANILVNAAGEENLGFPIWEGIQKSVVRKGIEYNANEVVVKRMPNV